MSGQVYLAALEARLASREGAKVSRIYSAAQINQQILETFELVGGVSRFALWANDDANYSEFLAIWAKIAPKVSEREGERGAITYQSNVPASPLSAAGFQRPTPTYDAVLIEQAPEGAEGG